MCVSILSQHSLRVLIAYSTYTVKRLIFILNMSSRQSEINSELYNLKKQYIDIEKFKSKILAFDSNWPSLMNFLQCIYSKTRMRACMRVCSLFAVVLQ